MDFFFPTPPLYSLFSPQESATRNNMKTQINLQIQEIGVHKLLVK